MDFLRIMILVYLIATPVLLIGTVLLSFRTRSIITSHMWLRRYILPSVLLFALMVINGGIFFRLFPSVVSKTHITCVSHQDFSEDIASPFGQSFVGLIEVSELDYIKKANVFDPEIIGYTNEQYYNYELLNEYMGALDEFGLLHVNENQPAFLMEDYPCATLQHQERLTQGVYLVYMDEREQSLPYRDEWYSHAYRLFSFEMIEEYDLQLSYDLQSSLVKEEIENYLAILASE